MESEVLGVILITGGNGFIGMHTARRFVDAGENVVLGYHTTRREPEILVNDIGKRVFPEPVDVADAEGVDRVVRDYGVTGIVHLAMPGYGKLTVDEDFETNIPGLMNVLRAARANAVQRVTVMSSAAVYEGVPRGPYREDARLPIESLSATGAFKKAWEVLGLHYAERTGLSVVFARAPWVWGPLYYSMVNLPSRLCRAAARGAEPNLDGVPGGPLCEDTEDDFLYVKDCARGLQLLQQAENPPHRVYNFGCGRGVTNRELADAVRKVVPDIKIPLQPAAGGPRRDLYLDLSQSKLDLGFEPEYNLEHAVADYVGWLREHPDS